MHNRLVFLLSTLSLSSASAANLNHLSYGIGIWNTSYAISANSHPNATKSVPFNIGAQNYTFQVNVAELFPSNLDTNTSIQNPSVAASFYNVLWSGTSTLNETLQNTWRLEKNDLCLVLPLGPLTSKATNGYKESDQGDCSNALGSECMKDLAEVKSQVLAGGCTERWMPKSCASSFGDGGVGSGGVNYASVDNGTSDSLDQKSPLEIAYYQSGIHEAGDMTSYNREIERLHVIFLSGTGWGVTPVCTRVNMTRVKKNNDAVFSAAPESSRRNLYLSAALALVVAAFML
ncbi:hypothetical protein D6D01_06943 [Aureobasidium pullulans]|uniref:Uncharacterized protein n=1 Tax=Aureobasidium pullulans TaxID=5580 RepID=A0A4S9KVC2_AURPU|nr:hypothetical protein D6D01_06943 [Aureobasidium pullulans]